MENPLLEIKDLSIDFKTEEGIDRAVKNISITLNKGEIIALVGESGSGKTVTSLAILKLLQSPPAIYSGGQILFSPGGNASVNLLNLPAKDLQKIRGSKISMIFQEPMTSLNPVKTCGSQVMEAILIHKKISKQNARQRTIDLFRKVNLSNPEGMLKRYPHQLSGGQKQRVMIAMAMSCDPSILIADEPTTALDVTVQKKIIELIKKLRTENGMGVIFITHDLGLVSEIADKVVVMYQGSIVETAPATEILSNPSHPYTKALIACRPTTTAKGNRLPVISDFMEDAGEGQREAGLISEHPGIDNFPGSPSANPAKEEESLYLLTVENLKVYFPIKKSFTGKVLSETRAVDGVSFNVLKGETLGLVGESGCGKTTLGRALIRLIQPTDGKIFFNGKNIAGIPAGEMRVMRKDIQIIFQDPYGSLNPRMTIGQAINEPMKIHGIADGDNPRKKMIMDLLEKVDLRPEHFNRYPHEFSGGQRQRICIARALSLNPEFIICDESVSALDVSVQAQVLNLLNDLKAEFGFTAIFISHDLGVVHYISDRIMVMKEGKIVETGTADEIYFSPSTQYTRELIAAIPGSIT